MKIPKPTVDMSLVASIEEWLDQDRMTEIIRETPEYDGIRVQVTRESDRRRLGKKHVVRPIFQTFPDGASSGLGTSVRNACQCYRFEMSWNCPQHQDREGGPGEAPQG